MTQRTGGVALNYTYYNTGRIADLWSFTGTYDYDDTYRDELWRLTTTTYGYDQVGNLVSQFYRYDSEYQYVTEGDYIDLGNGTGFYIPIIVTESRPHVYNSSSATYDGLGRMLTWTEASGSEMPAGTITYSYDANSNVRRSNASFTGFNSGGTAADTATTQDYWFRFDALNRVVTERGVLSGGAIVRSTTGNDIYYDLAGQRVQVLNNNTREDYAYDAGGRLEYVYINTSGTGSQGALRAEYDYDAMGRQTSQIDYQTSGAVAYQKLTTFNAKGQITTDTTITQHSSQLDKTVSTYAYGSGSSYALGQVVSDSTDVYVNNVYQHTTTQDNEFIWGESALLRKTFVTQPGSTVEKNYGYVWIDKVEHGAIGGQRQLTNIGVRISGNSGGTGARFTNDAQGQIMHRWEADLGDTYLDSNEYWHRFGGRQIGYVSNNGTVDTGYGQSITNRMTKGAGDLRFGSTSALVYNDFDQSLTSINSYNQGSAHGTYTARQGESLAGIAANLWGDASLWYKLAQANGLTGQSTLSDGQTLIIPAGVYKSTYNASTFTPYDPADLIGDPTPTALVIQPKPKKNKLGFLGQLFLAAIGIIAAIATGGAAAGIMGAAYSGTSLLGGALAGAAGAFGAGALAGTGLALTTTGAMIAGSIGAAAGSIVSQGVGVAVGIQDKFSWNAVGLAAVGGAIGASGKLGVQGKEWWSIGARQMVGSAIGQGIGVATGMQSKFSWAGVAGAGVGAAVASQFNAKDLAKQFGNDEIGLALGQGVVGGASAIANAATRSLIEGTDFGDNIQAALPDVIGSVIGGVDQPPSSGPSRLLVHHQL